MKKLMYVFIITVLFSGISYLAYLVGREMAPNYNWYVQWCVGQIPVGAVEYIILWRFKERYMDAVFNVTNIFLK